jgi:hypothetical protein
MNNNYIVNEYNINYDDAQYFNSFTTMMRNTINNSEEFIQEQEYLRNIQEYENELRRERELMMQYRNIEERIRQQEEITQLFIDEIVSITQQQISVQNYDENIINDERMNINNERINNERINNEITDIYLQNGDELIETCSICLDDVNNVETTSKLSCGHHFHTNCIRLCLERSLRCPLCRQNCLMN